MLEIASQQAIDLNVVPIWRESPPDAAEFDALLLLGGPPNVDEESRFPFLVREKQFIQDWLQMDKPCMGFCLGHQLLADAFKAHVGPNFMPSIGFIEGHLTHEGRNHPLFKGIENPLPLYKWHGQAIQTPVPHNFLPLATSSQCVVESFTIQGRPHIIGLQNDNHAAHPDDVRLWLQSDRKWLERVKPEMVADDSLIKEAEKKLEVHRSMFTKLFKNFISIVQG